MGEGGSGPELMRVSWGRYDLSKAFIGKWDWLDGKKEMGERRGRVGGRLQAPEKQPPH